MLTTDLFGVNFATTKAGLAVGTTTTLTTGNATQYAIGGKSYTAAASANGASPIGATPTLDANTGVAFLPIGLNKAGIFAIGLNASGALVIAQGGITGYSDASAFEQALAIPSLPDTATCIGYELVKVISTGSAWTMGVSNQASQTGITKVLVDVLIPPNRPQVS